MKKRIDSKEFFKAVITLKTEEECAQRFQVACLLTEGKSYVDVNKLTGASTATICRVSKCLNYGDGGYKTAIDRVKENSK